MRHYFALCTFVLCMFFPHSVHAGEAAFTGLKSKVYFFKDGEFVRYQKGASQADAGFPKAINEQTWPGLKPYGMDINAALTSGSRAFFFLSDGRYIQYNLKTSTLLEDFPRAVSDENWRGLAPYAKDISAAIKYNDQYVYFFLSDGRYILYNLYQKRVSPGYPKALDGSEWRGLILSDNHLTSIFPWSNSKIYCFLSNHQYMRWDKQSKYFEKGYPRKLSNENWPSLGDWFTRKNALRTKEWKGELLDNDTQVVFTLPRRMSGPIMTGPNSQPVDLHLSVDPFLAAKSERMKKSNIFTLYTIERKQEEGLLNNNPGLYQKVIIKGSNGRFLGVSESHGGLIRADRTQENASVFILDRTWGNHTVLHVYQRDFRWQSRNNIPMLSRYLTTYFYSYGNHTYGSINMEGSITPGSLLKVHIVQ